MSVPLVAMAVASVATLLPACGSEPRADTLPTASPPSMTASRAAPTAAAGPHALLNLPRLRWYGGPAYYARFSKAAAAGWTSPHHFPIAVFFGKPADARRLAALGVNTYMGAEHDGSPISRVTRAGISVLAQDEWTTAEIGNNPRVVGYHVSDECEMGNAGCGDTEAQRLATQQQYVDARRSLHDGRFIQANFGNGVLGSWWAPHTMGKHVALMDVTSVDKYAYTSPVVDYVLTHSPYWPRHKQPASSLAYGWLEDRMESYASPVASKPNWVLVETRRPYLTESDARTIEPVQVVGAVWDALLHGAAGITYFQHNNDPSCGNYSLLECGRTLSSTVKALDAQIRRLAPVLNTQSYAWRFGHGIDTMLKARAGHAYIFAMTRGGSGSRTFRLPPGVTGPIQVVGEHRSIAVSHGRFTDTFPHEYTHHIYRAALR